MPYTQVRNNRDDLSAPEDIGERLREWRAERGLTIDDLAYEVRSRAPEFLRFGREFVRRYEAGSFNRSNLNLPYLVAVCSVLGHSPAELGDDVRQAYERLLQLVTGLPIPPSPPHPGARQKGGAKAAGVVTPFCCNPRQTTSRDAAPEEDDLLAA